MIRKLIHVLRGGEVVTPKCAIVTCPSNSEPGKSFCRLHRGCKEELKEGDWL